MKFRSILTAICVVATANLAVAAPFAYVANSGSNTLSVIDTASDSVTATVPLPAGSNPAPYAYSVAVGASGQYAYVGIQGTNKVAIVDTATNAVSTIDLGTDRPGGLAVNAAETRLYVASSMSNTLIVIDISNGASEVGRVAVENAAISNPEGVVLSPAGNKAYVANSSTGTVAEVSLDEASNTYARTALITVGEQPMQLAMSAAGKLYVGNMAGAKVSVIDTANGNAVTALPVGLGALKLSVSPSNGKVYAPSSSLDQIYEIDGTSNAVSETTYAVAGMPFGSEIAPNNKLYLTMHNSNEVAVFNPATHSFATPIALTGQTKPTSLGDFIGPVFDWSITATNSGGCTIAPVGTVPVVNGYGRKFSITQPATPCEVKVNGNSVGQPTFYEFTNITANGSTIDASPAAAGTYFTLSGDWISAYGACVESIPAGINCESKSAKFLAGTPVTLKASAGYNVKTTPAITWGGACATAGPNCSLVMDADKTFGATVQFVLAGADGPFFNATKSSYHGAWSEVPSAAAASDHIKISSEVTDLVTDGTAGLMVKVSNQWKRSDYGTKDVYTPMKLTITAVGITIAEDSLVL